jgi:hypothetical protein
MRDVLKAFLGLVILFASVLAVAWGLAGAAKFMLEGVNGALAAALVAGATTVIVSVVSVVAGRYLERRAQIEANLRKSKMPVYAEVVAEIVGVLGMNGADSTRRRLVSDAQRAESALEAATRLTPQIVAWAGDEVLIEWSWYCRHAADLDPVESLLKFEELLLAIRKDVGHSDIDATKAAVLDLFVNDTDGHLSDRAITRQQREPRGGSGSSRA